MSKIHDDEELLSRVKVATPCSASWAEMRGGDQVRFCAHCQKKVYNLSEMTASEAAGLVRESEGRMCVRYYRRADGTMLTQDCPTGVRRVRRRIAQVVAAICGPFLLVGGFMHRWRQAMTLDAPVSYPAPVQQDRPNVMGDIAPAEFKPSEAPFVAAGGMMITEPVEVKGEVKSEPIMGGRMMMGAPAPEPLRETMGKPRIVELPMAQVQKGKAVSDARRDPFAKH